ADRRDRDRGRRGGWLRTRARGGEILLDCAAAGCPARDWGHGRADRRRDRRVADAGRTRIARGRAAGTPVGVDHMTRTTNARVAGFTFLIGFGAGIASLVSSASVHLRSVVQ